MQRDKCKQLTIGIPVRNEERVIERFIDSLGVAIHRLPVEIETEVFVCLNSTTDNSELIIDSLVGKYLSSRMKIKKIYSGSGKIVAQREIIRSKAFQGRVCFIDADVILDSNCLKYLWSSMELNNDIQIAYASVQPIHFRKRTVVEKLQEIHYSHRWLLSERKYFHGRTFMLRAASLFEAAMHASDDRLACKGENNLFNLMAGPRVDDIFLSRIIVHEYGHSGIKEIEDAIVRFIPPRTLSDFYQGQKRMLLEIRRLDLLFPEHAYVQRNYFERTVSLAKLFKLRLGIICWYLMYLLFERSIQAVIRLRIMLAYFGFTGMGELWVSLKSTKVHEKEENNEIRSK